MQLKLSNNSKTKFSKQHKNTFGLLHGLPSTGGTCIGATCGKGGCLDTRDGLKRKTCYVEKITQIYKQVGQVLTENTEKLREHTKEEMVSVIRKTVTEFVSKSKPDELFFRLHWAGDFFSEDYTKAWADIIKEFPAVTFWVYTRSNETVHHLFGIDNLTVYLSCDPVNFDTMLKIFEANKDANPRLGMAWLGNTAPDPAIHRWVKCPEITGKVKNTVDGGACSKCRLCVDNFKHRIKNIQFLNH